jgi:hypothetical protein
MVAITGELNIAEFKAVGIYYLIVNIFRNILRI